MRDLVRARSDFKDQERKARQQLNGFLQRHGHVWPPGKSRWTKAHYNWLESISFPRGTQQVVLQDYINAVAVDQSDMRGLVTTGLHCVAELAFDYQAGVAARECSMRGYPVVRRPFSKRKGSPYRSDRALLQRFSFSLSCILI